MKTIYMAAMALAFATPAAAQPHQGHAQHQATPTGPTPAAADHAGHAQHQNHGPAGADHSKHAGCCGDTNGSGKMDCCEGDKAVQQPCCEKHAATSQAQPQ